MKIQFKLPSTAWMKTYGEKLRCSTGVHAGVMPVRAALASCCPHLPAGEHPQRPGTCSSLQQAALSLQTGLVSALARSR